MSKRKNRYLLLMILVLGVKLGGLVLDRQPRFLLGDSQSYLVTAFEKWVPPDRSFSYGLLLRRLVTKSRSLARLVLVQSLIGTLHCLLLAWILDRFFQVRWSLILPSALLCAAEPIQLFMERYVMTETVSGLALALTLVAGLSYVQRSHILLLAAFHAAAIGLVSLRLSHLPLVATATFLLPILAWMTSPETRTELTEGMAANRISKGMFHLVISTCLFFSMHAGYRHLNGYLAEKSPAYIYEDGFFQVAAWAPLLRPQDAPDEASRRLIAEMSPYPLRDLHARSNQRWSEGGLVARLSTHYPNPEKADRIAGILAGNAALRAPLALVTLAWQSYRQYWNPGINDSLLLRTSSTSKSLERLLKERFDDFDPEWGRRFLTPLQHYYRESRTWYLFLLAIPFWSLPVLLITPGRYRRKLLFVAWVPLAILAAHCLVNTGWSFRHLASVAWTGLILCAVAADHLVERVHHFSSPLVRS